MKTFGILAHPAGHSLSPAMFNAAFKAVGIDAEYRVFDIREDKLVDFMEVVKHEPINGLSVSLPHKESVMNYLNEIDDDAKKIGAVNTVVNRGGFLYGYNTDFVGAVRALQEVVELDGKKIVLLGAGGAARALTYGFIKEGAEVVILNIEKEKAKELADEFGAEYGHLNEAEQFDGDILVNATSIWTLKPEAKLSDLVPSSFVQKFETVMDIVYKPLMTPLLKVAESMGKKNITGDKMLLYQALEQFKLFTEKEAPIEVMRKELEEGLV